MIKAYVLIYKQFLPTKKVKTIIEHTSSYCMNAYPMLKVSTLLDTSLQTQELYTSEATVGGLQQVFKHKVH